MADVDVAERHGPELLAFPAKEQPWSPEGCVTEFLEDIRAGKIEPNKIMILWFSIESNGNLRPHRWFANVTNCEEVALLELGKHIAIAEWKD